MSATPSPDVAVVVVNWNGGDLLRHCLNSIRGATDRSVVQVVVVDNGSTDDSLELAANALPDITIVRLTTNLGFAAGANAGILASDAPFVILLNNDATAGPHLIDELLAPFGAPGGERIGATTGRVLLAGRFIEGAADTGPQGALRARDGSLWRRVAQDADGMELVNSTGNEVTRSGNGRDRDWLAPVSMQPADPDVFGFNGGCAALRRAALAEVGVLHADLFMYYEDSDLSWRLRRGGWQIRHVPDAVSVHLHAASSGTSTPFFLFHNARNRLDVAVANAPWPVIGRAFARTIVRAMREPRQGATRRALAASLRTLPRALRRRAAIDRTANTARRTVARLLVND